METKIRRKGLLICLFLAALTCFALMGFLGINSSPKTAYAGEVTSIKTEADLWDALQTSGSYRLDRDIHLLKEFAGPHDHSYDVTGEIVLDLNGHMIDRATSMHWQFDIIKDAQLTIMDSWGNGCSAVNIYNISTKLSAS